MNNFNPIKTYITVTEVFPEVKSNFQTFIKILKQLSRTDTIFYCARLNIIICNSESNDSEIQKYCVGQFLLPEDINNLNKSIRNRNEQNFGLFFRGQILELIRWVTFYCEDFNNDGTTFENIETRRNFVKALLIASDISMKRLYKTWSFEEKDDIHIKRNKVIGSMRKIIESNMTTPYIEKPIGRGIELFYNYMPNHYKNFKTEFKEITKLNIDEYYKCLSVFITNSSTQNSLNTNPIINLNCIGVNTNYDSTFTTFLNLESQDINQLKNALWEDISIEISDNFDNVPTYNFKVFRDKPIIVTTDGRTIILDPVFFSEKASSGPLFYISGKTKNQDIFNAFGDAFEQYSCDILSRMFPTSKVLLKRLFLDTEIIFKKKNVICQIDAYINDITEVFIFEIKSAFINDSMHLTDNYESYLDLIRDRYSVSIKGKNNKSKGVGQLVKIINQIIMNDNVKIKHDLKSIKTIYPILLVHDSLLNTALNCEFLANEFKRLFKPDNILNNNVMIKNNIQVNPLILLNIDELENIETALEHYSLKDLLYEYSLECPDRNVSIHNFVANSRKFHFYPNKHLSAKALDFMTETINKVFKID